MITEHDLEEAIAECEGQRNPTSSTCMKLAAFYTIRDKMFPENAEKTNSVPQYSYAMSDISGYESETEFGQIVRGLSFNEVMPVIDELMTALSVLNPGLYRGVMRKLEN